MPEFQFDFGAARKAGATNKDIADYFKKQYNVEFDFDGAFKAGAADKDVLTYLNTNYGSVKKKEDAIPVSNISDEVLATGFVSPSSVPSSATLSPLEIPRPQGQSEKVRVEAPKPKPKPTYGGSGVLNIGEEAPVSEKAKKMEALGMAFKPETQEMDLIRRSLKKGELQGRLANTLPVNSRPTTEQLKEIAKINRELGSMPRSKAEKAYEKDGFGMFKKDPVLGAEFLLETILTSGAALFESGKRTVPAAVAIGAGMGSVVPAAGTLAGAGSGLTAGLSTAGLNLSTSGKILDLLNDSGVDVSDEDSLIKAFSDEKKMSEFRKKAINYGIPILVFDLAAAGLAGRFANKAIGKSIGAKALAGAKEVGLQSVAGSGGELAGQLASGQKVDWGEVALEGVASIATDVAEYAPPVARMAASKVGRKATATDNKTLVKQVVNLGEEVGKQDAIDNLKRDLNNGLITEEEYKEGVSVVEKAAEVVKTVPEEVPAKQKAEIVQSVIEDREPDFGLEDISDEEYNVFVDSGFVTEDRLKDIAKKVKDQEVLDDKEKAIFTDKTAEINQLLQEPQLEETPLTEEQLKGEPENITQPIELEPVDTSKDESRIKSSFESNIEALINPETGLAATIRKMDTGEKEKDAFFQRIGITRDEYNNLNEERKQKIQDEWVKSDEFKQFLEKIEQPTPTIQKETTTISETRPELRDVESTAKAIDDVYFDTPNRYDAKSRQLELMDLIPKEQVNNPNLNGFYKTAKYTPEEVFKLSKEEKDRLVKLNDIFKEKNREIIISEAYHKAKADGSNPELVKAVEELLVGKEQKTKTETRPELIDVGGSEILKKAIADEESIYGKKETKGVIQDKEDAKAIIKNRTSNKFDIFSKESLARNLGLPVTYFDDTSFKDWVDINPSSSKYKDYQVQFDNLKEKYKSDIDAYSKYKEQTTSLKQIDTKDKLVKKSEKNIQVVPPVVEQTTTDVGGVKAPDVSNLVLKVDREPTQETPAKTLTDKFKDIADIQLSDEAPTLKKRKITEYLKQNPEIAETVKNFSKATEYLEKQGRLKKSSPDCP